MFKAMILCDHEKGNWNIISCECSKIKLVIFKNMKKRNMISYLELFEHGQNLEAIPQP